MKKQTIIFILSVAFTAMSIQQNAVARKVMYLGHQYKGHVNKEKVPFGMGKINIGGLIIEGDFKLNSVSNAKVYIESVVVGDFGTSQNLGSTIHYQDKIDVHNREFTGSVTFDESNNITLKSNGILKTHVYQYGGNCKWGYYSYSEMYEPQKLSIEEQLESDHIVNYGNFEPYKVKLKVRFSIKDVPDLLNAWALDKLNKLNPPQELLYEFESKLEYINLKVKREFIVKREFTDSKCMKEANIGTKVYVIPPPSHSEMFTDTDYKDKDGRIWNFRSSGIYSVLYPDGSYYKSDGEFKVIRPDGKIVYRNSDDSGWGSGYYFIQLDNGITVKVIKDDYDWITVFLSFKDPSFKYIPSGEAYNIYTQEYFENLPSKEIVKFIKEKVIPYLLDKDKPIEIYDGSNHLVGWYYDKDGKYVSYAEEAAKAAAKAAEEAAKAAEEAAKAAAEKKQRIAYWTKKFGFNPFGKTNSDLIKPGRSFSVIKEFYYDWFFDLSYDQGNLKLYHMYSGGKRVGRLWVSGDKITAVSW